MTDLTWVGWFGVALVTLLGDPLVLGSVGLAAYWLGEWRPSVANRFDGHRGALLLATILGAVALTAVLKTTLAVSRPASAASLPGIDAMPAVVQPIYTWLVGPGGYAFPSGHAIAATVGWGGLAWVYGDRDWRPALLAGALITAVAASRVALGVHRPVEVIVGVSVGLVYLLAVVGVLGTPRRAFALAGVVGAVGVAVISLDGDGVFSASGALGAAVGWELLRPPANRRTQGGTLIGLAAVVLLVAVRWGSGPATLTLGGVVAGAVVIAAPKIVTSR